MQSFSCFALGAVDVKKPGKKKRESVAGSPDSQGVALVRLFPSARAGESQQQPANKSESYQPKPTPCAQGKQADA